MVIFDKLLYAIRDVFPQFPSMTDFQVLRDTVFGLDDFEFSLLLWQDNLTNSKVCASHVEGKKCSTLVSSRVPHYPGRVHRLAAVSSVLKSYKVGLILTMLPPSLLRPDKPISSGNIVSLTQRNEPFSNSLTKWLVISFSLS